MNLFVVMMATVALSGTLAFLFKTMKEEKEQNNTEPTSFECGFCNMNDKKMMFSTSFIMMVILFVMFDIEISIMIPMMFKSNMSTKWIMTPSMFFITLSMVLLKEWKIGTLEWSK